MIKGAGIQDRGWKKESQHHYLGKTRWNQKNLILKKLNEVCVQFRDHPMWLISVPWVCRAVHAGLAWACHVIYFSFATSKEISIWAKSAWGFCYTGHNSAFYSIWPLYYKCWIIVQAGWKDTDCRLEAVLQWQANVYNTWPKTTAKRIL